MEANTFEIDSVQSFLQSINNPSENQGGANNNQGSSASAQAGANGNGGQGEGDEQDTDILEKEKEQKSKEFLDKLNGEGKEKGEGEGDDKDEKDKKAKEEALLGIDKLSEKLVGDKLIFKFEDDSLPSNYEELKIAIQQTADVRAKQTVSDAWKERVDNLPPSLKLIHEYAESGVTSASEFEQFVHKVSYAEQIAALDPKKAEDQEKIVTIQLLMSGLGEDVAREQVAEYKALNKLEGHANTFYPALKRRADEQIIADQKEVKEREEDLQRYTQNNAQYVAHFIDNPANVLPFKVTSERYKAAIFGVAAQPLYVRDDGEVVFGWEQHIRSLQQGSEEQFKEYMDIMAFIANRKAYKEAYSKVVSNDNKSNTFKRIKTTDQNGGESDGQFEEREVKISKNNKSASNWILR